METFYVFREYRKETNDMGLVTCNKIFTPILYLNVGSIFQHVKVFCQTYFAINTFDEIYFKEGEVAIFNPLMHNAPEW